MKLKFFKRLIFLAFLLPNGVNSFADDFIYTSGKGYIEVDVQDIAYDDTEIKFTIALKQGKDYGTYGRFYTCDIRFNIYFTEGITVNKSGITMTPVYVVPEYETMAAGILDEESLQLDNLAVSAPPLAGYSSIDFGTELTRYTDNTTNPNRDLSATDFQQVFTYSIPVVSGTPTDVKIIIRSEPDYPIDFGDAGSFWVNHTSSEFPNSIRQGFRPTNWQPGAENLWKGTAGVENGNDWNVAANWTGNRILSDNEPLEFDPDALHGYWYIPPRIYSSGKWAYMHL